MNTITLENDPQANEQAIQKAAHPQLELTFDKTRPCPSAAGKRRQFNRANWWFQRMRQAVDQACNWPAARGRIRARPEQIWLPNTQHTYALAAGLASEEGPRQVAT